MLLPRTQAQSEQLAAVLPSNAIIPPTVLESISLIKSADLVISAGGTMNREAVVLGTPAYTVFAGEMGAVDEDLIERGLLQQVSKVDDIAWRRKTAEVTREPVSNREVILAELSALAKKG